MADRLTVRKGADGQWYWKRRAGNGETISHGEGYVTVHGAIRGANRANPDMQAAVSDEDDG